MDRTQGGNPGNVPVGAWGGYPDGSPRGIKPRGYGSALGNVYNEAHAYNEAHTNGHDNALNNVLP